MKKNNDTLNVKRQVESALWMSDSESKSLEEDSASTTAMSQNDVRRISAQQYSAQNDPGAHNRQTIHLNQKETARFRAAEIPLKPARSAQAYPTINIDGIVHTNPISRLLYIDDLSAEHVAQVTDVVVHLKSYDQLHHKLERALLPLVDSNSFFGNIHLHVPESLSGVEKLALLYEINHWLVLHHFVLTAQTYLAVCTKQGDGLAQWLTYEWLGKQPQPQPAKMLGTQHFDRPGVISCFEWLMANTSYPMTMLRISDHDPDERMVMALGSSGVSCVDVRL